MSEQQTGNMTKYRRKEKQERINTKSDGQLSLFARIVLILFMLLCLFLLFKFGGNGQGWYPGKPYLDR